MRITILTTGSQGDVDPHLALGIGLARAGHTVTLCTSALFAETVQVYGLQHAPLDDTILRMRDDPAVRAAMESQGQGLALVKRVMPLLRRMLDDAWTAAQGSDAIVYHPKAMAGYHIAERLAIPGFLALVVPLYVPTRAFAFPLLTG